MTKPKAKPPESRAVRRTQASGEEKEQLPLPQNDINLTSEPEIGEAPRRVRPGRKQLEEIELDPQFINSPERMNYALLLALLLREKSNMVSLTSLDLTRTDDTSYNILFALSLDGKRLDVSVVSSESGIIRSPEAKWAQSAPSPQNAYLPPPSPQQASAVLESDGQSLARALEQQAAGMAGARIVEMPAGARGSVPPAPANPKAAPPGYVFPFETGSSPTNLDHLQTELSKDHQIAQQEIQAASRVEGGSSA